MPTQVFALPSAAIRGAYLRAGLWAVPWLFVVPFSTGSLDLASVAEGAFIAVGMIVAAYWVIFPHKRISLSSIGIEGSSWRGVKVFIPWSEPVSIRRASYGVLPGITVKPEQQKAALFLPLAIAKSAEFNI